MMTRTLRRSLGPVTADLVIPSRQLIAVSHTSARASTTVGPSITLKHTISQKMSSIGPQLPSSTSIKRKRSTELADQNDAESSSSSSSSKQARRHTQQPDPRESADDHSDSNDLPSKTPQQTSRANVVETTSSSLKNTDEISLDESDSDTGQPKTNTNANPVAADVEPTSDSDSDSDDYGPALPSTSTARRGPIGPALPQPSTQESSAPLRDEWMLAPPTSTGYSERDPTKLKARKFVSKPSAAAAAAASSSSGGDGTAAALWTETPEEKLKRLQDSVLGRSDGSGRSAADAAAAEAHSREEEARNRKIAASIAAHRGKSLYDEHQESKTSASSDDGGGAGAGGKRRSRAGDDRQDDDPSKRAFDREKDMGLRTKISAAQRSQLVAKSANFGGRFQKGSFL